MIVVTHKYSKVMKDVNKIPPSLKSENVLTKNLVLSQRKSIYGEVKHIVWVYGNLYELTILRSLISDSTIILVCDMFIFYAVIYRLRDLNIKFIYEDIKPVEIKMMVADKYKIDDTNASRICEAYNYNLKIIGCNEENISLYLTGNKALTLTKVNYTYYDILLYICGKDKLTREEFEQTVCKYHHSKTHLIKYLRRYLKMYIDVYMGNSLDEKSKTLFNDIRVLRDISEYLTIEKAFYLYYKYEVFTCVNLLGGK